MYFGEALARLYPGVAFTLHDEDIENMSWPADVPRPTREAILQYMKAYSYEEQRRAAYPSFGDQLDAIMKGGQALADMQAKCMAVKAKFPKGA